MKAAVVRALGQPPVFGDFDDPIPSGDEVAVQVAAAALSPLVRARAAGTHYSSGAELPFVAGVDGVGRLDDGRRVYFALPRAPFGAMAERTVVAARNVVPLPDDLDDATAAAIANPGMSSWAALVERARLQPGETVLVNGATGVSGRLAVQIARHLGAARVIGVGRNAAQLAEVESLGADATVLATGDAAADEPALREHFAAGVDVVLDYVWGPSAERLLAAAVASPAAKPVRFVQIGGVSGQEITLHGAVLRASALAIMGSGFGSMPFARILHATGAMLAAATSAGFRVATRAESLADVERVWGAAGNAPRVVFEIG